MTNKELFYFMGQCLTLGNHTEKDQAVIQIIQQEKVDWSRFVAMGSNHLILPSLYLRFKAHGILSYLPVELSEHLKMVYELNYQRNITILEQINRINRLLAVVNIVPVYLKGAGNLLDQLYNDVGERIMGDIDLLVSDKEFTWVVWLLKNEGYEHGYSFDEKNMSITKHFPRLIHPNELVGVEVHRCPVEVSLSSHFNYAMIRPRAKLLKTEPPCYVLSDKHKVILNFMHGFMANDVRLMHVVSFRNMIDLYYLSFRVDIYKVLSRLPRYASQALLYMGWVSRIMTMNTRPGFNLRVRCFIWQQNVWLKSKLWFRVGWLMRFVKHQLVSSYLRYAAGALIDKETREFVFSRLTSKIWYKDHLKNYAIIFRKNLS